VSRRIVSSPPRAPGVRDARVLDAAAAVPRASYVPHARVGEADLDRPIPIGSAR
jgi:protein-L-isoaspartate(D-aspartate) O-methyltransferase